MASMEMSEADIALTARPEQARARSLSLGAILAPLADLLLPPVCVVCGTRIGRHGLICGACFAK